MVARTPSTPASKIRRTNTNTPRGSKIRERTYSNTPGGSKVCEENILVTVRLRPLSSREEAAYDLIAWDCVDQHTLVSKNLNNERPTGGYTFDRVFDPSCSNQNVYDEGARDVALSALNGINATIFAYGQTSSGKTFTMKGITENAVNDIFEHIKNTVEREFVVKFSSIEIYNETVVDLLNRQTGPLRLLDDPEKGTVVEKLTEEVVCDGQQLKHLINISEDQRQVGETALNDKSSRSHQIIRLTVQSRLRESSGCVKSLLASLNLVDLAGSERATQTNADGTRLKEGSHINRSLLTLTTVIRKLSDGKRNSHIPYRDSKLTRILQPSLGGNARTAIICTMSPALSHVEQSRNTLSFAINAKEVINSAQVNMVVAEKQLVKQLQKEVARLEAELRTPESSSSSSLKTLLAKKDLKIRQMEREVKELKQELEFERNARREPKKLNEGGGPSRQVHKCLFPSLEDPSRLSVETRKRKAPQRQSITRKSIASTDPSMLVHEIRKLEMLQRQLGEEANRALEVLQKEFASHRIGSQEATETVAKLLSEIKDMRALAFVPEHPEITDKASLKEEITRLNLQESDIAFLEERLENVQKSIDKLVMYLRSGDETPDLKTQSKKQKATPFAMSNSGNIPNLLPTPCPLPLSGKAMEELQNENRDPQTLGGIAATPKKDEDTNSTLSKHNTPAPRPPNPMSVKKLQKMFKTAAEENIRSIKEYVTELKERVAKLQYQKQLLVCQVLELEAQEVRNDDETDVTDELPMAWSFMFEEQRKKIIMLWHLCHVSIIHRTQFYILFRGDPDDQIYMEVELRRLTWLEQQLTELGNDSPALLGNDPANIVSSSIKALKQEREYLAKRVSSKLTAEERELLYMKWDIPLEGKQRRRLQLVNKLWTDPLNMQHVRESAEIVAKLVGFCESGKHVTKEMFALNFVSSSDKKSWNAWNLISNLLHL